MKHLPQRGNQYVKPVTSTRYFPNFHIAIMLISGIGLLSCNKNYDSDLCLQQVAVNFCYKDGAVSTLSFETGNKVYVFDSRNGIDQVQNLPTGVYNIALDKNNSGGMNVVTVVIDGQQYTRIRSGQEIKNASLLNYYVVTKNF